MMNPMELQDDLLLDLYDCGALGGPTLQEYNQNELDALRALKSEGFIDFDRAEGRYYITAAGEDYIQTM